MVHERVQESEETCLPKKSSQVSGLIAFQTAWLKAHYPVEFLSAALSSDMDDSERVRMLLDDCKNFEIEILKPDINVSHFNFSTSGDNDILFGLGAIKGLGKAAIENIISEREQRLLISIKVWKQHSNSINNK